MEKTIEIDGQMVPFKTTAATALLYKAQFQRDYLIDILKLYKFEKLQKMNLDNLNFNELEDIDFDSMYRIIWALAKTADRTITDHITWLDQFSEFPVMDIVFDLIDLIGRSVTTSKKKRK
jgi:hypothetical protein